MVHRAQELRQVPIRLKCLTDYNWTSSGQLTILKLSVRIMNTSTVILAITTDVLCYTRCIIATATCLIYMLQQPIINTTIRQQVITLPNWPCNGTPLLHTMTSSLESIPRVISKLSSMTTWLQGPRWSTREQPVMKSLSKMRPTSMCKWPTRVSSRMA